MDCQNQVRFLRTIAVLVAISVGVLLGVNLAYADPVATDAFLCGQVLDDYGVPVTNINVFAEGVWGQTNTFSGMADLNGNFQIGVVGGVGGYFLRLDKDPDVGALSRGLVSFWVSETVGSGETISNLTLVARRITGSITVKLVNGGPLIISGLVAKQTIDLTGTVVTDSFDSTDPLYTNSFYSPTKVGTNTVTTNIVDIGGTNTLPVFYPTPTLTNSISPTNFNFHYVSSTNVYPVSIRPNIPITNVEVGAFDGRDSYICTPQVTDTNGTAVLYVCNGDWSLTPDCRPLDEMKLDCQINSTKLVTVTNNDVFITLTYYTNWPLQIFTNMVVGTNGVPYSGSLQPDGGYWPFTWSVLGGTLPPGLSTNQYGDHQLCGTPTQEGSYTFTVQLTDNMAQTVTTNLTITILPTPPPKLISPVCLDASQFQLHLAGISNRTYAIQFTADLTNWTTLFTTNAMGPDVIFVDTNAGDGMRFYRAVQVP